SILSRQLKQGGLRNLFGPMSDVGFLTCEHFPRLVFLNIFPFPLGETITVACPDAVSCEQKPHKVNEKKGTLRGHLNYFRPQKSLKHFRK
ncbi:MAG: hypothetical protein ACKVVO_14555, partial [Opitutaceae bacterium]